MVESTNPPASTGDAKKAALLTAIEHWPGGIAYVGGFRILGTPLGFGKAAGASLRFMSTIDSTPPKRGTRVLISPFVAAAIDAEGRGLDALHLGYDRKIRLGRMDIRLLSAGLGHGSAQIEVTLKNRTIVYTDGMRLSQPLASEGVSIPNCDLLLLDAKPAEPRPPSPRGVSSKLAKWIHEASQKGEVPVICASTRSAAMDAVWALREMDMEVRAQRGLYEMLKRIESLGYAMPRLRRLEQELPERGVILHDADLWPTSSFSSGSKTPTAFVGPGRSKPQFANVGFRLGEGEDRPGIVSYVKKTGATEVALGPKCDEATAKLLTKAGIRVFMLKDPKQMSLNFS